jgi:hypothetical protein
MDQDDNHDRSAASAKAAVADSDAEVSRRNTGEAIVSL